MQMDIFKVEYRCNGIFEGEMGLGKYKRVLESSIYMLKHARVGRVRGKSTPRAVPQKMCSSSTLTWLEDFFFKTTSWLGKFERPFN